VRFSKQLPGLWVLDECRKYWRERDREIDGDLLMHLATSCEPFECLLNLADPRFETPGDMPLRIQAFCRDTGQPVPRKPGPIARCILESLALLYRKTLHEMSCLTGREFSRVYIMGEKGNKLLHHFTANALQIPVLIAPPNVIAIGNIVVQALGLGHIGSLEEARDMVRSSFRMETIMPHAAAWDAAYARLAELTPADPPKS
jgi:rhamnulokinase